MSTRRNLSSVCRPVDSDPVFLQDVAGHMPCAIGRCKHCGGVLFSAVRRQNQGLFTGTCGACAKARR